MNYLVLKLNGLWDLVSRDVQVLLDSNLVAKHRMKDMKARCIFLDGVSDHIMPHILRKDIERHIWLPLTSLYQRSC